MLSTFAIKTSTNANRLLDDENDIEKPARAIS
jgi:hypothetical protein